MMITEEDVQWQQRSLAPANSFSVKFVTLLYMSDLQSASITVWYITSTQEVYNKLGLSTRSLESFNVEMLNLGMDPPTAAEAETLP